MQVQKDEIRKKLIQVAQSHFLRKGYLKSSMRAIASEANVGLANIYNYFPNKDALLHAVVAPVIERLYDMLMSHHDPQKHDYSRLLDEDLHTGLTMEYMSLLQGNRKKFKILFFQSEGSSLEKFTEEFTDKATRLVLQWFESIKANCPEMDFSISSFTIHLHTVWEISLLKEIVMHNVTDRNIHAVLDDFIRFEISGWRKLMRLDHDKQ